MAAETVHEVKANDCLSSIAKEYGFTWNKLWDHGPNAALKAKRKDPNILMPGDVVHIPPFGKKEESKSVDNLHRFKRKAEQAVMHVRLLVDGEPMKDQECVLFIHSIGQEMEKAGKTDSDGNVEIDGSKEIKLPGNARSAYLNVGKNPDVLTYHLMIGTLAPYDELLGVQQRLNNLGYSAGTEDGMIGPRTKAAVLWFQQKNKLTEDGIPGSKTQSKLKELHGS